MWRWDKSRERACLEHPALTGMEGHITWAGGQKEPSRAASKNGISATLTQLNPSSPNALADQLQRPSRAAGMEKQQFPHTPKAILTSLTRLLQLLCMSTGALSPELSWFPNAVLGHC